LETNREFEGVRRLSKDRLEGWLPGPVAVVWNIGKKN